MPETTTAWVTVRPLSDGSTWTVMSAKGPFVVGCPDTLTRFDEADMEGYRKRFGMLFQMGALLNSLTVHDNIALPLREPGEQGQGILHEAPDQGLGAQHPSHREATAGVATEHGERLPHQVGGAQARRKGLTRAAPHELRLLPIEQERALGSQTQKGHLLPTQPEGLSHLEQHPLQGGRGAREQEPVMRHGGLGLGGRRSLRGRRWRAARPGR